MQRPTRTIINGVDLNFVDSGGSGENVVVLIHGFPFSHEMWSPQFERVARDHRVVAYDIRGHGKSGIAEGQYTMEFFVDDLIALLDHLKVERAVLCGLSMGGYIALRAVERNPERVRGLVLCDTQSHADSNEAKLKRAASIRAVKKDGVPAFAEGFLKAVFTTQTLAAGGQEVQRIKRIIEGNSSLGICGSLLALAGRTDTTASLATIKVPTLILVGEHDALTPPQASQEMNDRIPNSEIHIIPSAAHLSNVENPEEFNGHLLSFLGGLS